MEKGKNVFIVLCGVIIIGLLAIVGLSLTGVINIKTSNKNSVSYEVVDRLEQDSLTNYQELYVNNILVELSDKYARINVTKLSNIFIVEATNASSTLYAVDKDANIIGVFAPNKNVYDNTNRIITKAYYRDTYRIEGNNIYVTTDSLSQNPNYILCNMITNDDDIVVYEEKFTYLGNNQFSEAEVVNTITRKQYMADNNLTCGNKNNTELSYNIESEQVSGGLPLKTLYVNNKSVLKGTNIEVKQLNDILIVESVYASSTLYAVDKDANIIGVFAPNKNVYDNMNRIITKEYYRDTHRIEGNNIYVTTDRLSQNPNYILCNMITNDDDIVVYEEKLTYLGNNQFSNAEVVNSITRKQYMQEHNISCNNKGENFDNSNNEEVISDKVNIDLSIGNVTVSKDAPSSKILIDGTINLSYDNTKYIGVALSGYCLGANNEKYLIHGPGNGGALFKNDNNRNLTLTENIPQSVEYTDGTVKAWSEINWENVKIKSCKIDNAELISSDGNMLSFKINYEKEFK